jgi:hypothetical protein
MSRPALAGRVRIQSDFGGKCVGGQTKEGQMHVSALKKSLTTQLGEGWGRTQLARGHLFTWQEAALEAAGLKMMEGSQAQGQPWANRSRDAISKTPSQNRTGGVVQGLGPEFKSQHHQKKKKR